MKLNKILSAFAAGVLVASSLASCTDEVKYDPSPVYDGDEVYFSAQAPSQVSIPQSATEVSVTLYRTNGDKAITVGLEGSVTNAAGEELPNIFSVPTEVTFDQGVTEVPVQIGVDFTQVVPETPYTLHLKVRGEDQTPYGTTELQCTLINATLWTDWEEVLEGDYAEVGWDTPWYADGVLEYGVEIYTRHSQTGRERTQFRFEQPFSDLDFDFVLTAYHDLPVTINEKECFFTYMDDIYLPDIPWNGEDGAIIQDLLSWYVGGNKNPANIDRIVSLFNEQGWVVCNYCPELGTLHIPTAYMNASMMAEGRANVYGTIEVQLPGFLTYGVLVSDGGVIVDATGVEQKIINVVKTADTPAFKAQLYKGKLTKAEAEVKGAEMAADEDVPTYTEASVNLSFELENGDYTVVAVALDADGAVKYTHSYAFTYESTIPDSGYRTIGMAPYSEGLMPAIMNVQSSVINVEVQQNQDNPNLYRLKNVYRAWAEANDMADMALPGNYYITIDVTDPTFVLIDQCNLGLRPSITGGDIYMWTLAGQQLSEGMTKGKIKMLRNNGTFKNGIILFAAGKALVAPQNQLPEFTPSAGQFMIDLNKLEPIEENAPIRGQVMPRANCVERMPVRVFTGFLD